MEEDRIILSAYKKALQQYFHKEIVDLDESLSNIQSFLIRLEDNIRTCGPYIRPNRQSRSVFLYFRKGSGEKIAASSKYSIRDRTLMMIPGGTVHSGLYEGENAGYYLSFNLKFFLQTVFPTHLLVSRMLFNRTEVALKYLNEEEDKQISDILETILKEKDQHNKFRDDLIALKILEFLILSDRFLHDTETAPKASAPPVYLQYVKLIEKKYREQHLTGYYADQLHIHPNSLNSIVKKNSGTSAKKLIDLKLITEARYLLQHTSGSVKEISFELGFGSPSYFFRFFKKHSGQSPQEFRATSFDLVSK